MTINSTDQETVMFCKNFTAFGLIQKKIPSLSVSISFQIRDAGASSAVDIATSGITSPAAHLGGPSTDTFLRVWWNCANQFQSPSLTGFQK